MWSVFPGWRWSNKTGLACSAKPVFPDQPARFFQLYPQKLLQEIVNEFYEFYQNADLASYSELLRSGNMSVSQLLNEAWQSAQTNPLKYFEYEINAIDILKKDFGL